MTGLVQERIDRGDGHALRPRRDLLDVVAGADLSLLQHADIKAGPIVRDEQGGHLRFVHADADPVAGDTRLCDLEHGIPDPVPVADAHLVVGKSVDGKILAELPIGEVAAAEPMFPIAIGADLIHEDGPVLAAMARQIPLAVTIDIEPPHHASALHLRLPHRGVDNLALPRDVLRQAYIDRKQAGHRFLL